MQATMPRTAGRRERRSSSGGMRRAVQYLAHYRRQALLPYVFLIIATLSQLAVPRMVRNIIDAVTSGYIASQVNSALDKIPTQFLSAALGKILTALNYPADMTVEQLRAQLQADITNAPRALVTAIVAIVIFAVLRGVFSFLQAFWAEKNSQSVAYDLRNDLYAKIQRLSFSYHDRNQTGQLMIRATDDVEKVRLFIGQGLLQLVGALILLSGHDHHPVHHRTCAWPGRRCRSCRWRWCCSWSSAPSRSRCSALVQQKLSTLNTVLQENLAGIKVIKAFTREKQQQAKFHAAAERPMDQAIKLSRLFTFLFPLVFLIANLGQAAILYVGGRQIIAGAL